MGSIELFISPYTRETLSTGRNTFSTSGKEFKQEFKIRFDRYTRRSLLSRDKV